MKNKLTEDRQKLVDLCMDVLDRTRDGMRLSKNARVGIKLSIVQSLEMPDALVKQGIEALHEFTAKLR